MFKKSAKKTATDGLTFPKKSTNAINNIYTSETKF
jgi:hypothetical protein